MGVADCLNEKSLAGPARLDRWPGLTALEQRRARGHLEAAHPRRRVAREAVLRQHRAHVRLEELDALRARALCPRRERPKRGGDKQG